MPKKKKTKNMRKQKITKEMTFQEVLTKYPKTIEIFHKYGMYCIGCVLASQETIEQGAKAHGINIKKLIEDLNKAINKKQ